MAEITPPGIPSERLHVHTRLNRAESIAFAKLQGDLGFEGHGSQSATLREVLRERFIQNGYLGKPKP